MLRRSITTLELIQLNKMFSYNRGYKDLIRDFKKDFNVDLPKDKAKSFLAHRSWKEVLLWLTGDLIDTRDLDKIPEYKRETYELLDKMIELNKVDEEERIKDINDFLSHEYFIPENVKYFNLPLYGEIITYKYKDPFLKCFLLDATTHKVSKIEDVYISDQIPYFLLSIIRKINYSKIATKKTEDEILADNAMTLNYITYGECQAKNIQNIFDSELFHKYNIVAKT